MMKKDVYTNMYLRNEILNAILGAKKLIEKKLLGKTNNYSVPSFDGYQNVYFCTNENINGYLNILDLSKKKNALAVTASGDHTFNLITKDIMYVDTFDINKLSEYVAFGLKKAMILKYNYEEFLNKWEMLTENNVSLGELTCTISDLLPYMDEKYRIFWREILDYNYALQKNHENPENLILLLCHITLQCVKDAKYNNNYLTNEEKYNHLKENLGKANITYTYTDAEKLPEKFKYRDYDIILLSNILSYFYKNWGYDWGYDKLDSYLKSLEKITKKDGIIFLHYLYLYEYLAFNKTYQKTHQFIINSSLREQDFKDMEMYPIDHLYAEEKLGIILKRN